MANFMLLLHDRIGQFDNTGDAEMMAIIKEYGAWSQKMRAAGRLVGGEKLTDEPGRNMRKDKGKLLVTDGPFAETKELLGGYFAIAANDYAEACELAEDCPHLKYGGRIEVRQIHEL